MPALDLPPTEQRERHPGDVLRVLAGLVVLAVATAVAFEQGLRRVERNSFRLVNELPDVFRAFFDSVQQAGAFPSVVVVAGLALVARRPRLAGAIALAGTGGWFAAKVLKELVARPRPFVFFPDAVVRGPAAEGLGFPSGHTTVATALAAVVSPYLPRWARRAVWFVVLAVGLARIYVGAHLPLDVAGGLALGWVVGAGANLAVGTPRWKPDVAALCRMLAARGLTPASVEPVPGSAAPGTAHLAVRTTGGRRLRIRLAVDETRDADLLVRFWRRLRAWSVADVGEYRPARRSVEHEALVSLLAERAGVSVPRLVLAETVSPGVAALVEEEVDGASLALTQPVPDQVMAAAWGQVAALHRARIAHGALNLSHLLADRAGRVWVTGLRGSEIEAPDGSLARDVAELLASMGASSGPVRPVEAALRALGPGPVAAALPMLEPLVPTRATREAGGAGSGLLADLRREVEMRAGEAEAPLEHVPLLPTAVLVTVAVAGPPLSLLAVALGGGWPDLVGAGWSWVAAAAGLTALASVAGAIQLQGAVAPRLPPLPVVGATVAAAFAARAGPGGTGGRITKRRHLRRCGVPAREGREAVALATAAGRLIGGLGLVLGAAVVASRATGPPSRTVWAVAAGMAVGAAVAGLLLAVPAARAAALPDRRDAAAGYRALADRPGRLLALAGGTVSGIGLPLVALDLSLRSVGLELPFAEVALVWLAAALLAGASPVPAGLGVVEAALTAGLVAAGSPAGPALAGVVVYRLVTLWLPAGPAAAAFVQMRRAGLA